MVFGRQDIRRQPSLDHNGHNYDANILTPYRQGPSNQSYITDPSHRDYDPMVDPNLQLRTVRTAAASIAESHRSEQRRDERRKAKSMAKSNSLSGRLFRGRTQKNKKPTSASIGLGDKEFGKTTPFDSPDQDKSAFPHLQERPSYDTSSDSETEQDAATQPSGPTIRKMKPKSRRTVYANLQPPSSQLKNNGNPITVYPRNKVRTSKYTIITFLPRFLFEQFRRVANIYFLGLVVLQVFPTFGATIPQIAMLPLVAILAITAIKDSIEDHRRHVLDNQVNNSAVTRLGNWRNVNQAKDPRTWYQKLFGLGGRGNAKVTRGVRKLREKEDAIGMRQVRGRPNQTVSGFQGGQEFDANFPSGDVRSNSMTSSRGLHTIASESERDDTSLAHHSISGNMGRSNSTPNVMMQQQSSFSISHASSREGVVDYRRHTPGTAKWERTLWKKLEVGDIVLLREDEQVPADIVILNTSDPDGNAYIETKNLDGETNLKVRKCLKATMGIQSEEDIEHSRFAVDSEPPHANLYSYNGLLKYYAAASNSDSIEGRFEDALENLPADSSAYAAAQVQAKRVEPITINEMLLRGCALRNTDWVIGLVLFTGQDTKIMLNSGETPSKRSKIEKETNFNVVVNFIILLVLCVICAVVGGSRLGSTDSSRAFYEVDAELSSNRIVNALIILGSCLVVFQNIVPISLYISIEIVKTIQAFFIYQDREMYYEPLDYPCVPKTWNISDDLGQIEYIFSDKTGTLTQNVMEFKKCSINGIAYGEGITEAMIGAMKREGKDVSDFSAEQQEENLAKAKDKMVQTMSRAFKNRYLQPQKLTLISPQLADVLASKAQNLERKNIATFFRALALCHTALADHPDGLNPFIVDYKAQSPDEAALVAAARDVGAVFISRNNQTVDIEVLGQPERYTPLKVLEFNSTRKRMSVIVRESSGKILMITKGADSVIYQRLRADHPEDLKASTHKDLEDFANAGLRTLCIAYRYLQESEYIEWAKIHDEAATSLTDRDEAIDEASEKIEIDLTLLGATALEDKLQQGVPEAIETLRHAGIKLWILTGDKLQTAIEISFSCNLLSSKMEIMIISADHEMGTRSQIEAACNKIAAAGRPVVVEERLGKNKPTKTKLTVERTEQAPRDGFAVVIDGETLRYALEDKLKPLFLALTTQCEAVVCCRVSPAQKALTVKLVKDGKKAMTLAIGDGANDVAMIQEAHCGVGIAGLEGAQASMSADYAVGQFRYLNRLLLVHGQLCYHRISDLHKVFFYKNVIWTTTMFLYQIHCDFSGSYLFDYTYVLLYNLVFSSLCVIVIGALDQVVNAKALLHFPQTYKRGVEGKEYTKSLFYMAMIDAAYQGAVCYFIPWWLWTYAPMVGSNGQDMSALAFFGTTIAAGTVTTANLYAGLIAKHWTVIFWVVEIVSLLSVYVWTLLYSAFPVFTFENVGWWVMQTVNYWAVVLLIVIVSLVPRFFARAWRASFHPNEIDLVREAWVKVDLKEKLGMREPKEKGKGSQGRSDNDANDGLGGLGQGNGDQDLETNRDTLFYAAKRSTVRQKQSQLHADDDEISETSADPFPTNNYEQHYARNAGYANSPQLSSNKTLQGEKQQRQHHSPSQVGTAATRGMPFYVPSPLATPASPSFNGFQQQQQTPLSTSSQLAFQVSDQYRSNPRRNSIQSAESSYPPTNGRVDIPMINIQRASDSTYGYEPGNAIPSVSGEPASPNPPSIPGQPYADLNNHSRSWLVEKASTDSLDRQFDEAFGVEYETFRPYPAAAGAIGGDRITTPIVVAATSPVGGSPVDVSPAIASPSSYAVRYHDRFRQSQSQSPPHPQSASQPLSQQQIHDGHMQDDTEIAYFGYSEPNADDLYHESQQQQQRHFHGHPGEHSAISDVSWHTANG